MFSEIPYAAFLSGKVLLPGEAGIQEAEGQLLGPRAGLLQAGQVVRWQEDPKMKIISLE